MHIVRTDYFLLRLQHILDYIAQDKLSASLKFKKNLDKSINNLVNLPYKYRPSDYYEDKNIRDMTFKGYTIIYRVKESEEVIEVLEIFNKNLPTKNKN
jgi:plasmid stabilization system protein ParE